jgi:hypothetical protein
MIRGYVVEDPRASDGPLAQQSPVASTGGREIRMRRDFSGQRLLRPGNEHSGASRRSGTEDR